MDSCERCGERYEPYTVYIENDFVSIAQFTEIKERYGSLCRRCRTDVYAEMNDVDRDALEVPTETSYWFPKKVSGDV